MNNQRVCIIGGGIGGLGAACILAKAGYHVEIFEKNDMLGGRARILSDNGFRFDMGPSWVLMPDVFRNFFELLGTRLEDELDLIPLDPSYRIFFEGKGEPIDIFRGIEKNLATFEKLEPGSSDRFNVYLRRSEQQYTIAKERFLYKNIDSLRDLLSLDMLMEGSRLSVFTNMDRYVRRYFKTPEMQKIMQYTLVFLGSSPYNTPALYSIMSHIDFNMGVFYPRGGIHAIIEALQRIGERYGITYHTNAPIRRIKADRRRAVGIEKEDGSFVAADIVISNADMRHTEAELLDQAVQSYPESYWSKRTLAPSALLMYLGVDGKIPTLTHHNLIFSHDWKKNFSEIFDDPTWPDDPSLYICAPSVTDSTVAPPGKENLCVLVPIAPGLKYSPEEMERYAEKILSVLEREANIPHLRQRIETKRLYCVKDFARDYNSHRGTALGLAHTLGQTALFRPSTRSKKIPNLYYVGADTNPGIGMPICLISAELVYKRIIGNTSAGHLKSI